MVSACSYRSPLCVFPLGCWVKALGWFCARVDQFPTCSPDWTLSCGVFGNCVVLLQGFVFLHSLVDQTQVGDFTPTAQWSTSACWLQVQWLWCCCLNMFLCLMAELSTLSACPWTCSYVPKWGKLIFKIKNKIFKKSEIYLKTLKLGLRCHYLMHSSFSED